MRLTFEDIQTKLTALEGWYLKDDKIHRHFKFSTFAQSVQFFNAVATIAQQLKHHPDFYNCYDRCSIAINTHDFDGITQLDFDFAQAVNDWLEANSPA
jgi:4a-hydroxytetrahydrobiopterin dehydratase